MLGYLSQGDLGLKMGLQSGMLKHTRSHNDYLDIFLSSCSGGGKGGEEGAGDKRSGRFGWLRGRRPGLMQCTSKSDFRLRPSSGATFATLSHATAIWLVFAASPATNLGSQRVQRPFRIFVIL